MNIERTKRRGFILLFLGFFVGIPGVWLLLAPDRYEATARIDLQRIHPDGGSANPSYDPHFIQIEFEIIKASNILSQVVEKLNLGDEWGKRYDTGHKLETADAIGLLKQNLTLKVGTNYTQIDISFTSEDPAEAANIANVIAETDRDERLKSYQKLQTRGETALKEALETSQQEISELQTNIDQLKQQLNPPDSIAENKDLKFQPYWDAVDKMERKKHFFSILKMKTEAIAQDKLPTFEPGIIQSAQVPTVSLNSVRTIGKALLFAGVFMILAGIRMLWRAYFAAPEESYPNAPRR